MSDTKVKVAVRVRPMNKRGIGIFIMAQKREASELAFAQMEDGKYSNFTIISRTILTKILAQTQKCGL
ncbi:hypothetical protein TURU_022760 [Turdus rufiventris]|nr:hypothetical protein TURU_022760 [Turdus rufiventris]